MNEISPFRNTFSTLDPLFLMNDDTSASHTASDPSTETEDDTPTAQQDLHELVGELRAEVTRLKAKQAKARAQNWVQRHPLLALTLSVGVGAAAGYGAATAFRPRPPRSLSEHARQRLRDLTGDARKVASRLRRQLQDRAAESGQHLRSRAEETGRRLAEEARQGAQEAAGRASEQARKLGEEASGRVREATDEAKKRMQERRKAAGEEAREIGEALSKRATEAVKRASGSEDPETQDARPFRRSLLALAGLAAGGYLATKVRQWL